jgi:hypothetical protein
MCEIASTNDLFSCNGIYVLASFFKERKTNKFYLNEQVSVFI